MQEDGSWSEPHAKTFQDLCKIWNNRPESKGKKVRDDIITWDGYPFQTVHKAMREARGAHTLYCSMMLNIIICQVLHICGGTPNAYLIVDPVPARQGDFQLLLRC